MTGSPLSRKPASALVVDTALILYHEDGNPIMEFDSEPADIRAFWIAEAEEELSEVFGL